MKLQRDIQSFVFIQLSKKTIMITLYMGINFSPESLGGPSV